MIKPVKFVEGSVHRSNLCGDYIITKYTSPKEIHIMFLETGYKTKLTCSTLTSGNVRDKLLPTVYDVGVLGYGEHCGKTHTKEYVVWKSMLVRCYDKKYQEKNQKYIGCEVSPLFKRLDLFKLWYFKQVGNDKEGWHLDKDILIKGNKVYSEDACCFVPREINFLFRSKRCDNKGFPTGVSVVGFKYVARYGDGQNRFIGKFDSITEAFNAYKQIKESHIKEVANKWKEQIDTRVYNALMNYEVSIDD